MKRFNTKRFFADNLGLKVLSVFFSIIIWAWVQVNESTSKSTKLLLHYELPNDLVSVNELPKSIMVEMTGAKGRVKTLNNFQLHSTIDLRDAIIGSNQIDFNSQVINDLPANIQITRMTPPSLDIQMDKPLTKELAVKANLVGTPDQEYKVTNLEIIPKTITIKGPQSVINPLSEIATTPVNINNIKEHTEINAKISLPSKTITLIEENQVQVKIDIGLKNLTRAYEGATIVLNSLDWEIEPKSTSILVSFPEEAKDTLPDTIKLQIDTSKLVDAQDTSLTFQENDAGLFSLLGFGDINVKIVTLEPQNFKLIHQNEQRPK